MLQVNLKKVLTAYINELCIMFLTDCYFVNFSAKHFPGGLSEWQKEKASLQSSGDV